MSRMKVSDVNLMEDMVDTMETRRDLVETQKTFTLTVRVRVPQQVPVFTPLPPSRRNRIRRELVISIRSDLSVEEK